MPFGFSNFLDLDIYSRRISFFYLGKEKISSKFGFILTLLYVFISITIFLYYFIRTISREDVTASDSTIYTDTVPSIDINPEIFNLAFGLEHPTLFSRFIDETIYYTKVYYIENVNINGNFVNKIKKEIKAEKCGNLKSGNKFLNLLGNSELNNSYCLLDHDNTTLKGGFKYDVIGYIKINIYPCINTTVNNSHCKPREVIDKFFNNTHFSILASDIALNPNNFSYPGVPILLNAYTSVNKLMRKDYVVKFALTIIETDLGFFTQDIKQDKYLRYIKDFNEFYLVNSDYYLTGKEILTMSIRLEDNIYFQKRTYKKMAEVFSTTGGYMQLIYSVFALVSLLTKKMNIEKKLLNSLFYFNIKQKKVILSIEYKKKLNYATSGSFIEKTDDGIKGTKDIIKSNDKIKNTNYIPYLAKKSPLFRKYSKVMKSDKNNRNTKLISMLPRKSVNYANMYQFQKMLNGNDVSKDGLIGVNKMQQNNGIKDNLIPQNKMTFSNQKENNLNNIQINRLYFRSKSKESDTLKKQEKDNFCNIDFNIFEYYCLWKYSKNKVQIELFRFAYKFFRSQMDIVNFFNIIILTQIMMKKQSNEKHNYLSEIVELSM